MRPTSKKGTGLIPFWQLALGRSSLFSLKPTYQGTKLYTPSRFGSWLGTTPGITPDGERCTIQVGGTTPPAKGAAKIQFKATVVLTCGTDPKSTDKKAITIKKDQTETVGSYTVKVTGDGGKFGTPQLTIASEKNDVKTVEFFDAKGTAVPLSYPPYRSVGFLAPGKMQYVLYCSLPKKMDAVSVKVTYFTKTKAVPAPIDLNFGVGLD